MTSRLLVLESDAYDNRANIPAEWFARMEGLPEVESRRFLRLCHDEFEGKVFWSFTGESVLPWFNIPDDWPCIRAHDPGTTGSGWVWLSAASDVAGHRPRGFLIPECIRDGHIVTWHEYGPYEVAIEEQVSKVMAWDRGVPILFTGIDPSDARQQTGHGLHTTAELLESIPGFGQVLKAPNDENAFILEVNQDFASRRAWILDSCPMLIRQLRDEVYDAKSKPGAKTRANARAFHVLSAYKYGRLMQPELLSGKPPERKRGRTRSETGY